VVEIESFYPSQNINVGEFTQSLSPFLQFFQIQNDIAEVGGQHYKKTMFFGMSN